MPPYRKELRVGAAQPQGPLLGLGNHETGVNRRVKRGLIVMFTQERRQAQGLEVMSQYQLWCISHAFPPASWLI